MMLPQIFFTFNISIFFHLQIANTGIGTQSTLEVRHFCPKYMYEKLTKYPNFTWLFPEKLSKYPNFYYLPDKFAKLIPVLRNASAKYDLCPNILFAPSESIHYTCNIVTTTLHRRIYHWVSWAMPPPPLNSEKFLHVAKKNEKSSIREVRFSGK